MTRTSRTVRTYRYVGPDGQELRRVETTIKTSEDDGSERTEVQVSEDPGFPPEARPPGALAPGVRWLSFLSHPAHLHAALIGYVH